MHEDLDVENDKRHPSHLVSSLIWIIMNIIRKDSFEVFVLVASTGRKLRITSYQGQGVSKKVFWIFVRLFARVQYDVLVHS